MASNLGRRYPHRQFRKDHSEVLLAFPSETILPAGRSPSFPFVPSGTLRGASLFSRSTYKGRSEGCSSFSTEGPLSCLCFHVMKTLQAVRKACGRNCCRQACPSFFSRIPLDKQPADPLKFHYSVKGKPAGEPVGQRCGVQLTGPSGVHQYLPTC